MNSTDEVDILKARIIEKVKQIAQQKLAKKDLAASYTETINVLQEELDAALEELDVAQRQEIEKVATKFLDSDDVTTEYTNDR